MSGAAGARVRPVSGAWPGLYAGTTGVWLHGIYSQPNMSLLVCWILVGVYIPNQTAPLLPAGRDADVKRLPDEMASCAHDISNCAVQCVHVFQIAVLHCFFFILPFSISRMFAAIY